MPVLKKLSGLAVLLYVILNKQVYVSELNVRLMGMMFGGTIARVMSLAGKEVNHMIVSVTKK